MWPAAFVIASSGFAGRFFETIPSLTYSWNHLFFVYPDYSLSVNGLYRLSQRWRRITRRRASRKREAGLGPSS